MTLSKLKVLLFILTILPMLIIPAFADHMEVTIIPDLDSDSPTDDCVDTAYGCFIPGTVTVDLGGAVIFLNTDSEIHTFTSGTAADGTTGEFDTSLIKAGQSYEWIADVAGEIPYFCTVHPWEDGLIIVTDISEPVDENIDENTDENITDNEFHDMIIKNQEEISTLIDTTNSNKIMLDEHDPMIYANMYTMAQYNSTIGTLQNTILFLEDIINQQSLSIITLQTDFNELYSLLQENPEGFKPIINDFVYLSNGDNSVTISWSIPGEPIVQYKLIYRNDLGSWTTEFPDNTSTSYTIYNLENIEYEFKFSAENEFGKSRNTVFSVIP